MMSNLSLFKAPNVDYTNDNLYGDKIFYTHNNTILKTYKYNLDKNENEIRFNTNFRFYPLVCLRWIKFVETFSEDNPFDARKFTNYELNYDPVRNKNDRRPFFNSEYLHKILKNIQTQKKKEIYKHEAPYYGDLSPIEILYTLFYNLFLYYRLYFTNDAIRASDRTIKKVAPWGYNPREQKMKNDTQLIKKVFNALKTDKIIKSQETSKSNNTISNWFDTRKRNKILLLRNKNPLIGDIVKPNNELYKKLISTNYTELSNVFNVNYSKMYNGLTSYISTIILSGTDKIDILFFINNQINQKSELYFYPPYLQNYIALNGLYMLYKVIENVIISQYSLKFNATRSIIVSHSKNEIDQYENKNYENLKNISSADKSLIQMKYHNFIPNKYKKYNDYYLTYYSKN